MLLLGRCALLSALAWGQQRPPRSGPKARRSKGRRDGARRLEDYCSSLTTEAECWPAQRELGCWWEVDRCEYVVPAGFDLETTYECASQGGPICAGYVQACAEVACGDCRPCGPTKVPTSAPTAQPQLSPKPTPVPTAIPSPVPTPVPACCVEHQFTENGEVEGTTCYGGRSPWDYSTMTDLCTAGYSEYGEVAPPFRDCRQEAVDSGNCGDTSCEGCWDHDYWANVGYEACPDWVVDAINAEGAAGGQCADWVRDGYSYPSGSCGDHAWGADRDGYSKCAWLGREPYPEGDAALHAMGDDAETCCPGGYSYPSGSCGDHAWGADRDGYSKCAWLGREPYPEGDAALHAMGDDAETCCPGGYSYPSGSCGDHAWGADRDGYSKCAWLGRMPYPEGDAALHAMGDDAETCCPGDPGEDWRSANGCRQDYCTDSGNDCHAIDGEPATCSNGYTPTPNQSWDWFGTEYTCCPSATSCEYVAGQPFVLVAFEPDPATQAMLGLPGGEFSVGLNDAGKSYHPDEGGNVHSNTFFTVQTTEGMKMLHRSTDDNIVFPDMPPEWTTDATRPPHIEGDFLINVGLHVHCQDYAPGAFVKALGNVGSAGSWVVNGDGTISPFDAPHLILGWGDLTTASGSCGADNMNMDPQPNNLVLMDSATALGCEAAREADPAQMCAPVFRARGVDCDDAGHDHGGACDGIHLEAGMGEVCNWAHGETHGCPVVNTQLWDSELWSCDDLCGRAGGRCNRAAYMSNNHCGSDVTEQFEFSCWDHVNGMGAWVEDFDPEHALCWCEADDTDHWWHYYDEDDDDDDGLGGGSELVMSGGLVAIGLTFTGITIATIANLMQEQCALGPTIIFEAGTTHPYYISPNLCTIGTHTYASKKTVRDASPRKVCRKFCEAASAAGKLALKHVQGLTCYCKRR